MNIRKAGEDFYFLHKLFPTTVTKYIVDATVFPSPRSSHRVPFGTGRSIMDILSKNQADYQTYHPNIFMDLKRFCASVDQLWSGDYETFMVNQGNSIQEFIATIPFVDQVSKIKQHVSSEKQFIKSFYTWFNGFMILKFVHFARDHHYGKMGILEACHWLISQSTTESKPDDKETMLILMRELDRSE
jgi:hypothetical protein